MDGKLYKAPNCEHYTLYVEGKIFAEIDGHPLKAINNQLSLKNCKAIKNGYDLDELIKDESSFMSDDTPLINKIEVEISFMRGFQKALSIIGGKKFSEEDMVEFAMSMISQYQFGNTNIHNRELLKESLPQQTEWDVIVEMEVVSDFDSRAEIDGQVFSTNKKVVPKLDANDCLILKRKS